MSLFGAGIPHFIIEIAILLCPLLEIWKLHLPLKRKLAVAVMFASGILVCGSALMTIVHTFTLDKKADKDLTWDGIEDQIWAVCDVNLASLASTGSAPTYGSAPSNRRSNPDSDSEVGFAEEGVLMASNELAGSSKAFVMHEISSRDSDIERQGHKGIHVQNETKIVYHDA
ncbi:hypothetical protein N0V95_007563 [Ascochyta clinopodiicola]|nr:hypothetical protein N0V95_007563 [Ascochyta clinopodiicola]